MDVFVQSSKIFNPDPEQIFPAPTTGAYLDSELWIWIH
jgi:hypothetical protein